MHTQKLRTFSGPRRGLRRGPCRDLCRDGQSEQGGGALYYEHLRHWFRDGILMPVLAALFASPISMRLFTFGGRYLIEPLFLALLMCGGLKVIRDVYVVKAELLRAVIVFCIFATLLLFVGIFRYGDPVSSYGDWRCMLIAAYCVMVGYLAAMKNDWIVPLHSFCVSGFVLTALSTYVSMNDTNSVKSAIPILLCLLSFVIAMERDDLWAMAISLALTCLVATLSFYRGYMLCAVIMVVIGVAKMISILTTRNASLWSRMAVPALIALGALGGIAGYKKFMYFIEVDQSRYIQSVGKINNAISYLRGEGQINESEQMRMDYFSYVSAHWPELIVPGGLGYDAQGVLPNELADGNTNDSIFLFTVFHFGFLALPVLLWGFAVLVYRLARRYSWLSSACICMVMFIYFTMSAEMFTVVTKAVPFGLIIGVLLHRAGFRPIRPAVI